MTVRPRPLELDHPNRSARTTLHLLPSLIAPLDRRASSSGIALALNAARRRRKETLRVVALRCGLPVRYLAAFELDGAPRIFRTPEGAAVFLAEYARYLGLNDRLVVERFLARYGIRSPREARPRREARRLARKVARRRALAATVGAVMTASIALAAVAWAGPRAETSSVRPAPLHDAPAPRRPELPSGGRRLFPDYRVVAFYGSPLSPRMGRLGAAAPSTVARRLRTQAMPYRTAGRKILPAFDLVTTVTTSSPGADGSHTFRLTSEQIAPYLAEVRGFGGLLILDIQPGRIPFDLEVRRYEQLLRLPNVGVGLDPEWRVTAGQLPGRTIGTVDAEELNRTIDYLAALVRRFDLPQKLVVVHQFNHAMVTNRHAMHHPKELAVTFDFDGVGTPRAKILTYAALSRGLDGVRTGVKLYYDQDANLMPPEQVVRLDPEPDLVIYQ